MGLAEDRLTIRRDDIVDFPDLVSDIPELAGHAHARTFMPPIISIGGRLIWKLPEVSPRAQEYRGADQLTRAEIAGSVAGHLQADRHIDHRPRVRHRKQPAQAGRIL